MDLRALVLALLLALVASAPAAAWTKRTFPSSVPSFHSDGVRYAVFSDRPGHAWVFDDRHPHWRPVTFDATCYPGPTRRGKVLLQCPGPYILEPDRLLDLRTGRVTQVPGPGGDGEPVRLGRHWVEWESDGDRSYGRHTFTSLADGQTVAVDDEGHAADPDAVDVRWPLCASVDRPLATDQYEFLPELSYEPVERAGRWMVMRRGQAGADSRSRDLLSWRCGEERPRLVFRWPFTGAQVGGRVVTAMAEFYDALVYRLRDGRRARVQLPWYLLSSAPVFHTGRYLFAVQRSDTPQTIVAVTKLPL